MKEISLTFLIIACCLGCLFLCSNNPVADGNSSQTGNNGFTVTASAGHIRGTAKSGMQISIYAQSYKPHKSPSGFCDSAISDENGQFQFSNLTEGYYNLFCNDLSAGKEVFIQSIPVFPDITFNDSVKDLSKPGFLSGRLTDSLGRKLVLSYVYITGSPFYTVTGNKGEFLLGPIPAGKYILGYRANFILGETGGMETPAPADNDSTGSVSIYVDSISYWQR